MPSWIRCFPIVSLLFACTAEAPADVGQSDEGWKAPPPVDDPAYQAAKRSYDERARSRNAELVRQLDLEPELARRVEDALNAEHAARLANADRPDAEQPRIAARLSASAGVRELIGPEKAELLARLREGNDVGKVQASR